MGVAAELHHEPAVGLRCQVGGHDRRRAAVVVPGRSGHALVAEGEQLGNPDLVLGQDGLQGVVPSVVFRPTAEAGPWDLLAPEPAGPPPLLGGGREILQLDRPGRQGRISRFGDVATPRQTQRSRYQGGIRRRVGAVGEEEGVLQPDANVASEPDRLLQDRPGGLTGPVMQPRSGDAH